MQAGPLLRLDSVSRHFTVKSGMFGKPEILRAVDGVSFDLAPGESLGLVGESGCGKSTLARLAMRLSRPTSGQVVFDGVDISLLSESSLRSMRPRFQMVFQDPYASLNPRHTVYRTLAEPLSVHGKATKTELPGRVRELLHKVGLAPGSMLKYPHEFSGGQRQRVAVARALALRPDMLVADEPVSALDVSIQAQIVNLIADIRSEMGMAMLFISHNLAVVRHVSDRIAVMYLGRIVEEGPAEELFRNPAHPYTRLLLDSVVEPPPSPRRKIACADVRGEPPSPLHPPSGCHFRTRCPEADSHCAEAYPDWRSVGAGRHAACHRR